jgi:hypothetical protein
MTAPAIVGWNLLVLVSEIVMLMSGSPVSVTPMAFCDTDLQKVLEPSFRLVHAFLMSVIWVDERVVSSPEVTVVAANAGTACTIRMDKKAAENTYINCFNLMAPLSCGPNGNDVQ